MVKRPKTQEALLFLTLFSLSLLVVVPLVGVALTQPNGVNLFSSNIQKAAQTPGSIPVGQTWTYRVTYRNSTHNISATFSQHISGIVTITDWNGTQQQCYVLATPVDYLYLMETFGESTPSDVSKIFITVSTYLNTTNYSNPRTDILWMSDTRTARVLYCLSASWAMKHTTFTSSRSQVVGRRP